MRGTAFYRIVLAVGVASAVIVASALALQLGPRSVLEKPPRLPQLSLSIVTDNLSYRPGAPVDITIRVQNTGSDPVYIEFSSSCQATYRVEDGRGVVVYDASMHRACLAVVTNLTLEPGADASYKFTWDQRSDSGVPVPAGRDYRAVGWLTNATLPLELLATTGFYIAATSLEMNLGFAARTDRPFYSAGDRANVSITLTNLGLTTVTLHFGAPCFMEFLVYPDRGGPVYNSSNHWGCIQILAQVTLEPSASTTHVFPWNISGDDDLPLPPSQWYTILPRFLWGDLGYQQYVTRTDTAVFYLAP